MKAILLLPILLLLTMTSGAQSLRKYPISNSGCFIYTFCDPEIKLSSHLDSVKIYKGMCSVEEVYYNIICIVLAKPISDLDSAEHNAISYLDYLKSDYKITQSAGYGKGHRLNNNENTRGVIDYWEDAHANHFKVKAWTDGRFISILYAHSKKELPETKINVFLESFRLPE